MYRKRGQRYFKWRRESCSQCTQRGACMVAQRTWRIKRRCASRRRYSFDLIAARVESLRWTCRTAALLHIQYKYPREDSTVSDRPLDLHSGHAQPSTGRHRALQLSTVLLQQVSILAGATRSKTCNGLATWSTANDLARKTVMTEVFVVQHQQCAFA